MSAGLLEVHVWTSAVETTAPGMLGRVIIMLGRVVIVLECRRDVR